MNFAADILGILPVLRANAESLMTDTCSVARPALDADGNPVVVTDPETWRDVAQMDPVGARGVCKVQSGAPQARNPEGGEARFTVERPQVHLPVGDPVRPGDIVTILTCPTDPSMAGLVFTLKEMDRGSYRTAQRWDVEMLT